VFVSVSFSVLKLKSVAADGTFSGYGSTYGNLDLVGDIVMPGAFNPSIQSQGKGPAPPVVRPGAQFAVLEGNPLASSGDYTVRLKMPDGYRISPHWHPERENVTVISGTFKVGMGDIFHKTRMTALPAGSFAFLDPDMHHYAMASGPVVVQIHGMAPLQFNYVNPGDDPTRNK
jgi:quercetin dioxygenase-like cupin family protein